jgi:hypothetical protein
LLTYFCLCDPVTVERQRGALCGLRLVKAIVVHKIRKADFLSSIKTAMADFLDFDAVCDFYLVFFPAFYDFCRFLARCFFSVLP